MECWNDGSEEKVILFLYLLLPIIPLLQSSIIPIILSDCFYLLKMFDLIF